MSAFGVLPAKAKCCSGTGAARAARRNGDVPCVVYGGVDKPRMYVLPAKAVQNYCARTDFFSKVLAMSVDGEDSVTVLPKAVQYDPVTDCPIHIDFFRVSAHSEVKVSVPVEFIHADKSPAIKLGANLNIVMRTVHVLCSSSNIPEKFEIDLTGAGVGATFTVADLQVPDGCRVHTVSSAILANVVKAGQADAETSSSS